MTPYMSNTSEGGSLVFEGESASSRAKTPTSRAAPPSKSSNTAKTRASLQWDRPSHRPMFSPQSFFVFPPFSTFFTCAPPSGDTLPVIAAGESFSCCSSSPSSRGLLLKYNRRHGAAEDK
ncbi:hypothetical protein INR49_006500 [Caranx melampygus]|nr:hypothetical protein INR49_006500 [Caranx melampygus]